MDTKISIEYYSDPSAAFLKVIVERYIYLRKKTVRGNEG